MKLNEKIKASLLEAERKQDALVSGWQDYINEVDAYYKEKYGRGLELHERRNIAQCLENAVLQSTLNSRSKLFEATTSDNIEFLGIQLPVIAGLLPSLALNKLAVVQSLDRRKSAVFFMNVLYGQDKGAVSQGDVMIDAKTGHKRGQSAFNYASDRVIEEAIGTAGQTHYTGVLDYKPLRAGTVIITDGTETFTDDGNGHLVSDASGGTNGTINYETGAYDVTFASATGSAPVVSYRYKYEKAPNGVPEVTIDFASEILEAEDFPLKALFSLSSAIDAQKAHGIKLENELVKYLAGEIRFAMDHRGIDLIVNASKSSDSAGYIGNWDAQPGSGNQWLFKKFELLDLLEKGNNLIISKTLRGMATFIIAGNNVARVIRQLTDHFKPNGEGKKKIMTGPAVIGELDNKDVVQDPFIDPDTYTLGFKGDGYLFAGTLFAPYIPLFSTPTLTTSDLYSQKGFLSSAGYKVVNPGMYCYGKISNLL